MGLIGKLLGTDKAKNAAKNADRLAREQREREDQRLERIKQGKLSIDDAFSNFGDAFFGRIKNSHARFNSQQLTEQERQARADMAYSLFRNGMFGSSVKNAFEADLQKQKARGLQDIAAKGDELVMQKRASLEDTRSDLLRSPEATGDNVLASRQALTRADMIAKPQEFSPLGEMIKLTSVNLNNQLARERAAMDYGAPQPTFWTGAFGARPGSTVTRRG